MENVNKFRENLLNEICSELFEAEYIKKDVKQIMNYDLDSQFAADLRNKSLEEFKARFLQETDQLHEKIELSDRMDILKKAKKSEELSAEGMWQKEETVEGVRKLTYTSRRQVLLDYKQKLQETKEALAAELEEALVEHYRHQGASTEDHSDVGSL